MRELGSGDGGKLAAHQPHEIEPQGGACIMRISARNVLKGKINDVKRARRPRTCKVGDDAYAVIKASDVMVVRE